MNVWSAIDPDLKVRSRDLLLQGDDLVELIRLLLATRHLTTMTSCMAQMKSSPTGSSGDSYLFLLLHLVGSAKEAADHFVCCDSRGIFRAIESASEHLGQLRAEIACVRKAVAKDDPTSLYNRTLKPLRHSAAFHVDRNAVACALEKVSSDEFRAATTTESSSVTSFPLATSVLTLMIWPESRRDTAAIEATVDEILNFQRDIRNVAHEFYLLLVRLSTLAEQPTVDEDGVSA